MKGLYKIEYEVEAENKKEAIDDFVDQIKEVLIHDDLSIEDVFKIYEPFSSQKKRMDYNNYKKELETLFKEM